MNAFYNESTKKMPTGAGKSEAAIKKAQKLLQQGVPIAGMLVLPRNEIQQVKVPVILEAFGPETSPELLRSLASSLIIAVQGYADSKLEIYEIPEVRIFLREKCDLWSPWLFGGSIFSADLMAISLACLPTISCWRKNGEIHVRWKQSEMRAFLQKSLPTAAWLHNRAGIGKEEGCAKLKATAAYLGLPLSE